MLQGQPRLLKKCPTPEADRLFTSGDRASPPKRRYYVLMYEYPHFVLCVYAVLPVFVCDVAPGLELHRVTAGWADLLLSNQAPGGLEPVDKLV